MRGAHLLSSLCLFSSFLFFIYKTGNTFKIFSLFVYKNQYQWGSFKDKFNFILCFMLLEATLV